ncbi:insulin-degrading enzyme [Apiospora marii]|uniref:insulin-degrading enzyme n=1 Tax=Apiospora marii TaxID=335849 RepID=UPI0031310764
MMSNAQRMTVGGLRLPGWRHSIHPTRVRKWVKTARRTTRRCKTIETTPAPYPTPPSSPECDKPIHDQIHISVPDDAKPSDGGSSTARVIRLMSAPHNENAKSPMRRQCIILIRINPERLVDRPIIPPDTFRRRSTRARAALPASLRGVDFCNCTDNCNSTKCINRSTYMECHPDNCALPRCDNRLFSDPPKRVLRNFDTRSPRGQGLRTEEDLPESAVVIEYRGRKCAVRDPALWVCGSQYRMDLGGGFVLDAEHEDNPARYINHSCEPNCKVSLWDGADGERHPVISTINPVQAGTELTIDYNSTKASGGWKAKISSEEAQSSKAASADAKARLPQFHLPHKNQFIPTKLEVEKKEVKEPALTPRLLRNDNAARTWLKKDDTFWVPKANLVVSCKNPIIFATAENSVKAKLYTDLVRDALEYSYDADLAGLQYNVTLDSRGLFVEVLGYNDKLPVLLEQVLITMRDLEIRDARFDIVKERLSRITVEATRALHKQLISQMHIEAYVHGHLYKENALKLTLKPRVLPKDQLLAQEDATHMKQLTKSDMMEFYSNHILPSSPTRAKVVVDLEAQDTGGSLGRQGSRYSTK